MTFTKSFYIAAVLLLFPFLLSAQETANTQEEITIASIQDLHTATATDLLSEDANGEIVLSQKYYDTNAIPDRVARLIKESLLEDKLLAEQTSEELKAQAKATVSQEEEIVIVDIAMDSMSPAIAISSGGGE